jgi:hypothetical protein
MRMTNPLAVMNHLIFASLMLWFVVQHSLLAPSPIRYGPVDVAKALHYQPRTPPPILDPEQMNASIEEAEVHPYGVSLR